MKRQRGSVEMIALLAIVGLISVSVYLDSVSCQSKWELSGFRTQWGVLKGCVVQLPNGRWMPEDVIREIDLKDLKKEEAE